MNTHSLSSSRRWILPVFLAGIPLSVSAPAEPLPDDLVQVELLQNTLAAVADAVRPSVVAIRASRRIPPMLDPQDSAPAESGPHRNLSDQRLPAVGSGIIVRADGMILTNEHVIHQAMPEHIECILSDGNVYTVTGINSDPRSDLAILRINADSLPTARLGDLARVRQGHFAIVMGNPFGSANDSHGHPAMSFGIVSAIGRELTGQLDPSGARYYGNLIQTDARINPGNSGGPLLNIKGEVIGINVAISTRSGASEGVGYAIPIDKRTKDIIDLLLAGREVEYGLLGVHLDTPTLADRNAAGGPKEGGALVIREVSEDDPVGKAGIKAGAIIAEFDGEVIRDVDHLIRKVGAARVGKEVGIVFYQEGKRVAAKVIPARRPIRGVSMSYRWRGMRLTNPTVEIREKHELAENVKGIVVAYVDPDSPAAAAGLRPGQVIRRIGDVDIRHINDVSSHAEEWDGLVTIILSDDTQLELK